MINHSRSIAITGLWLALLLVAMVTLYVSISVLPAPPGAATPTWPEGIDLPDKLPRLP